MSNCKHEQIIIQPGSIEKKGDGVIIKDLSGGTVYCRSCNKELATEDIYLYEEKNISVAIPEDLL